MLSCRHKIFVSFVHPYYTFGLASIWIYAFLCLDKIYNWELHLQKITPSPFWALKKSERKNILSSKMAKKKKKKDISFWLCNNLWQWLTNKGKFLLTRYNLSPQILFLGKAINSVWTWETSSLKLNRYNKHIAI